MERDRRARRRRHGRVGRACYHAPVLARVMGAARIGAVVLPLALIAACGDATTIPEAASATPFTAASVAVTQQGNADVSVDTASVTFALDDTRSLVVHLTLTSHAQGTVTVSLRASLYDPKHNLVGDATGGQIDVKPGATVAVQLSGPTPLGTIASAVVEASTAPSPT